MPRNDGRQVAHAGNHLILFGVYIDLRPSVRSDRDAEKREQQCGEVRLLEGKKNGKS